MREIERKGGERKYETNETKKGGECKHKRNVEQKEEKANMREMQWMRKEI